MGVSGRPARHAHRRFYRNLRSALDAGIQSDRGSRAEPVRPRRRPAPARAGRPRPRAAPVRRRAGAGRPRPPGAQPGAHRPARRRQDRAAQRAALAGDRPAVGHRQDRGPPGPVAAPAGRRRAAHGAARARRRGTATRTGSTTFLGVLKAFALRDPTPADAKLPATAWQPGIDVPAARGRADSGDMEIDLVELFTDAAVGGHRRRHRHRAVHRRDAGRAAADDVSALCAACHELSQHGAPLIVVGAGLPHLPAVLSASQVATPSGCSATCASTGSTGTPPTGRCSPRPSGRTSSSTPEALDALYEASDGYPYFVQAYGKVDLGRAPRVARSPPTTCGWPRRRPRPSWRSASSAPGTSGPPRPSGSTCARWPAGRSRDGAAVADRRGRRTRSAASRRSLSPARDA